MNVPLLYIAIVFLYTAFATITGTIATDTCPDPTVLSNTTIIAVPWSSGGCYFHDKESGEN